VKDLSISLRLCVFARIKKEKIIGAQSRQAAKKGELFLCDSAPWREEKRKKVFGSPQFFGAGCKVGKPQRVRLGGPAMLRVRQALREEKNLIPPIQKPGSA
jgi:hypothetical protein